MLLKWVQTQKNLQVQELKESGKSHFRGEGSMEICAGGFDLAQNFRAAPATIWGEGLAEFVQVFFPHLQTLSAVSGEVFQAPIGVESAENSGQS